MRKPPVRSTVLLLLIGLAGLLTGTTPAFAGCHCQFNFQWSDALWGLAPTCEEAITDALNNVYAWIDARCPDGVCETGTESQVTPCMPKDGMPGVIRTDYQVQYKCWICIERPPRDPM